MSDEICSSCNVAITGLEPAYLINGEHVACRNCHDTAHPLCPHCSRLLTRKLPKTWSKCPECGERFWVEPEQWLYPSMILTPDQRKSAQTIVREMSRLGEWGIRPQDRKIAELTAQMDGRGADAVIRSLRVEAVRCSGWAGPPDPATLTDEDIDICVRSFDMFSHKAQVKGNYDIRLGDVVATWLTLKTTIPQTASSENEEEDEFVIENQLVCQVWPLALQRAANDPHTRKMISFCWAEACAIAGLDFRKPLRLASRYELLDLQAHKIITKVRIVNWQQPCPACRRQNGTVLTIAQALERMPIPCEKCTTRYDTESTTGPKGWCQCRFEAVFEGE